MWQGGESSGKIELFTRPTMAQPAANFNASCAEVQASACFRSKLKLELQPFSLASTDRFPQNSGAQA